MGRRAPRGEISSYGRSEFSGAGYRRAVYRKGQGPAVIVISEMPGITPRVLGFADRVVALGCSVVLPDLYGDPGRDPVRAGKLYGLRSFARACVSREFTMFALGRSSPIVDFLRELARHEHARCGGPGVGAIGMCFSGGFALAMATLPEVLAPVVAQPSLPLAINKARGAAIDCAPGDLDRVAERCQREGLRVLGLRFRDDPFVPDGRFALLKQRLGAGFVAIELSQSDGHPNNPFSHMHSVLTEALVDEAGEPTRDALQRVLDLFRDKLLGASSEAAQSGRMQDE
jgi:dienelactone hydrolase